MTFVQEFIPLQLDQLHREAAVMKVEGWRFIETHAVNTDDGVDLYYAFMKDGVARNYRIAGVHDEPVPTITDLFLAAFVFENEARELFGVDMREIAIDFAGNMYAPAEFEPMTIITPEMKAAREKAKKAAAAKADTAESVGAQSSAPSTGGFVMTPERQARLDAKMATMSPEKKAKVEAALARIAAAGSAPAAAPAAASAECHPEPQAKDPREADSPEAPAPAKDAALEEKLANMDPAKAAKVRAALAGKAADSCHPEPQAKDLREAEEPAAAPADAQLEALIGLMDESKASVVRAALNLKGGE